MRILIFVLLSIGFDLSFGLPSSIHPTNARIVNGSLAAEGQFPHLVSLQKRDEHACGASVIGSNWVLTAAHCCLDDVIPIIRAGTNNWEEGGIFYKVAEVIIHPDYDPAYLVNDICVLKLEEDVVESDLIQKIQLESVHEDHIRDATLAGWGYGYVDDHFITNKELLYMDLQTLPIPVCEALWNGHNCCPLSDQNVCGLGDEGIGVCFGDSGSPLIVRGSDGKPLQIGITSWAEPCAKGYPDVYVRVSSYIDWIQEVTNGEF